MGWRATIRRYWKESWTGPLSKMVATTSVDNIDKALLIQMPANDDLVETDCRFILCDAKRTKKWDFTPPWRENPMELRDFLRGQKVPLHRRGCAPVVYAKHKDKASLAAVFIEKKDGDCVFRDMVGTWVVNRKYKIRDR